MGVNVEGLVCKFNVGFYSMRDRLLLTSGIGYLSQLKYGLLGKLSGMIRGYFSTPRIRLITICSTNKLVTNHQATVNGIIGHEII